MLEPKRIQPRVSLLLATHNQAHTLRRCINSLLAQSYKNFTLTILNDGSTDTTASLLDSIQDERVVIQHLKNKQGFIPALNLAYQKSKPAAYYGVVYAHAFYASDYLKTLINMLIPQVKMGGVFCSSSLTLPSGKDILFKEIEYKHSELLCRPYLEGGLIFRRDVFKQAEEIFVSESKGIWETWQRMAKFKPFLPCRQALVRFYPTTAYSEPPEASLSPTLEKDILPHLKLRYHVLNPQKADRILLKHLRLAGHEAVEKQDNFDFLLLSQTEDAPEAMEIAARKGCPVIFATNQLGQLGSLYDFKPSLYHTFSLMTSTPALVKEIEIRMGISPLLYEPEMSPPNINRMLSQVPGLLNRYKTTIIVRSYASLHFLKETLRHITEMHHPQHFAEVVVLFAQPHAECLNWVKEQNITHYIPHSHHYFYELREIVQAMNSTYVMCVDAGVAMLQNWFYEVLPYLAHPTIGQVSSFIYKADIPEQSLPFPKLYHLEQFNEHWAAFQNKTKQTIPFRELDHCSDMLFLTKRSLFERALFYAKDNYPMAHPAVFSLVFKELKLNRILVKRTTGICLF